MKCTKHIVRIKNKNRSFICGKLRKKLLKRYGHCAITLWKNPLEIQMAHIIPKHIGYALNYPNTDSEINCILLSNGLHSLFDGFEWTVDVYSFLDHNIITDNCFTASLLIKKIPKPGTSGIAPYVNKSISFPIKYFPSLYAHYYTYLKVNYALWEPLVAFQKCISSKVFKDILQLKSSSKIKQYLIDLRHGVNECTVILDHDEQRQTMKILWNYWGYRHHTWEQRVDVPDNNIIEYENYRDHLIDPDWKPQ
jgi:REP element-mobilizing transposase RayT